MTLDIPNHREIFKQRDVRETATSILTDGEKVPIGAILPWLKTLTGTPGIPTGYVQCDGQTLNDAESVYNGVVIPNLNDGNYFLRGSSTSGGTGGSSTHTHALSTAYAKIGSSWGNIGMLQTNVSQYTENVKLDTTSMSTGTSKDGVSLGGSTDSTSTLPSYYNVVWIMRIK